MSADPYVTPAFPDGTDAIVFAVNDDYCPYLSVMLRSILDHAAQEALYDIVILHRSVSATNRVRLEGMADGIANVRIRFCCVASLLEGHRFYTGGKDTFSEDAYLRLLIPWVLAPAYEKALYLDSDMLAFTDVAPLLTTDLSGYLLASSRDLSGIADYYDPRGKRRAYRQAILPDEDPNDYFISGMLVLNLPAFRREFTAQGLLELAASRPWMQHDQDVLNVLCKGGRAKLLSVAWDVLAPCKPEFLPPALRREQEEALAHPAIAHFGGDEKPWKNTASPWMDDFWRTAARTPFYMELICGILEENPGTLNEAMLKKCQAGDIGLRYLAQYLAAWLQYKLRRHFGRHQTDG